jgi:hypothetical protein
MSAPKPKILKYYTYIPDRTKSQKYHTGFGYVKSAVKGCFGSHCIDVAAGKHSSWNCYTHQCYRNGRCVSGSPYVEVWELDSNGEYQLIHTIQAGTKWEDLPWNK